MTLGASKAVSVIPWETVPQGRPRPPFRRYPPPSSPDLRTRHRPLGHHTILALSLEIAADEPSSVGVVVSVVLVVAPNLQLLGRGLAGRVPGGLFDPPYH
jgi:hypothetical protein